MRVRILQSESMPDSPMDVAYHGDRCTDMDDVGLAHEDLFGLFTYFSKNSFMKQLFAKKLSNAGVKVERRHSRSCTNAWDSHNSPGRWSCLIQRLSPWAAGSSSGFSVRSPATSSRVHEGCGSSSLWAIIPAATNLLSSLTDYRELHQRM